uniref:Phytosulfokine n=1 Tax=Oryza punctata TaxID=4537 RepID=A0A0E0MCG9_ORYPU
MRPRGVSSSSSAAALALLLLFALCFFFSFSFHSAAAARAVPRDEHQENGGVKAVAVAAELVLQLERDTGNGDEVSELMGAADEAACEEGKKDDECMQRRMLRDAHLDYIYTQHKNKP